MTLLTTHTKAQFTGDGVRTVFPYDFLVQQMADMYPFVDDVQLIAGWSMDGVGDPAGGDVTFDVAPAAQSTVDLYRIVDLLQSIDWRPYGPFKGPVTEDAMDKITMQVQQMQEGSLRSVNQVVTSDGTTSVIFPPYVAGEVLYWSDSEREILTRLEVQPEDPVINDPKRRLYGRINSDGTLDKGSGGFTTGGITPYHITFDEPIFDEYVVVIGLSEDSYQAGSATIYATGENSAGFDIQCTNDADGDPRLRDVSFILKYRPSGLPTRVNLEQLIYGFVDVDSNILAGTDNFTTEVQVSSDCNITFTQAFTDTDYSTCNTLSADPAVTDTFIYSIGDSPQRTTTKSTIETFPGKSGKAFIFMRREM